ncbi:MAG: 4Fe-4S dicluster domain-containing protein [Proteobacteria bacterium]|nr:4Fe-4S dicluster domain-containing protein [Pseudomonadota bacterium]MBU4469793.1 4Fe-4S dicluster domain-containing protein [Pseudomonadota bacterium]MCG2753028.1 4Fe-4S dicluster domain-containing protein [Desulfobacteraceae bacterium]
MGCSPVPEKNLFALVHAPEDAVTGEAKWYASTCRECPAGCGILAKNREGRVVKIEGNPLHPVNRGKLCIRGQAALQGVYNPDRLTTPMLKENGRFKTISFAQADALMAEKLREAVRKGPNRIKMISGIAGESELRLLKEAQAIWQSDAPLIFEPYAYESLKTANRMVFGIEGLVSYHMEKADLLVSFGADFLETWLSPVEYARKFKTMHGIGGDRKGFFAHIGPYRSLTGANADLWLSCHPGSEAVIALGLIREVLSEDRGRGRGAGAPVDGDGLHPSYGDSGRGDQEAFLKGLEKVSSSYTPEKVIALSGVAPESYQTLIEKLRRATSPLILGTGFGNSGTLCLQTDIAVNLLNALLDSKLSLLDFCCRHGIEKAAKRPEIMELFQGFQKDPIETDLLLIHHCNPVFTLAGDPSVKSAFARESFFSVCFADLMDETASLANLVYPVKHSLESWGDYSGHTRMVSLIQPTMGGVTEAPALMDLLIKLIQQTRGEESPPAASSAMEYVYETQFNRNRVQNKSEWVKAVQTGGGFTASHDESPWPPVVFSRECEELLSHMEYKPPGERVFLAVPDIRFFDGRGASRSWLCEIPDPLTKVAWQTTVLVHPQTLAKNKLTHGRIIRLGNGVRVIEGPVYETMNVRENLFVMAIGQGHTACGRYAKNRGENPFKLLNTQSDPLSGKPFPDVFGPGIHKTGKFEAFAHTDGSLDSLNRKIAVSARIGEGHNATPHAGSEGHPGLSMEEFPLTLPLPEGYDKHRDFYPPHDHDTYRWSMVIDLDRCIGCGACAAACYAENNIGVVGLDQLRKGREMAWMSVERYRDQNRPDDFIFMPMLCQHCDNAPCEGVCPVYAPHHSKEGLNNQIYNRCIGTRFCAQNCPYNVRRFNWLDWERPGFSKLQLNPNVTVRSKGVMEKCSFCVQRIKDAHGTAKNENRAIRDLEVIPACVQTCPTDALAFGNLMDPTSRVSLLVQDTRAYQAMGYLNTKPAVIYLKKLVWEI